MARQYAVPGSAFAGFLNETGTTTEPVPAGAFVNETSTINTSAAPASGSLLFTGFAPSPIIDTVVAPGAGAILLTGFAPTPINDEVLTPGAGSIVFTGFAPTTAIEVAPGVGAMLFTGFAPTPIALAAGTNFFFRGVF